MFEQLFGEKEYYFNQKKFNFKIEQLKKLSNETNFNEQVHEYKIQYISKQTNEILKEITVVGKQVQVQGRNFNSKRFETYYNKFKLLKKLNLINYSFRIFKSYENIDCVNFNISMLPKLIFLKNLKTPNSIILPSNIKSKFNINLFNFGEEIWFLALEKILQSSLILMKNNFKINFLDVWMIKLDLEKNTNNLIGLDVQIIDLDNLIFEDEKLTTYQINLFFVDLLDHLKPFLKNEYVQKYDEILKKVFYDYLLKNYNVKISFEKSLNIIYRIRLDKNFQK